MGLNHHEFELHAKCFNQIEGNVLEGISGKVLLEITKSETMYDFSITINANLPAKCDNCLDEFELKVSQPFSLLIKLSDKEDYSDDEIIYITKNVISYDFAQYLYESCVVSLPARSICSMAGKTCNTDVVGKINNFASEPNSNNPMWDKLKGILNK